MNRLYLVGLLALLVIIVLVVLFSLEAHKSSGSAPILPSRFNMVIGIGTHGNLSSEQRALTDGVKYFRNDISIDSNESAQIEMESRQYGAQYLGILDYDTIPGGLANRNWTLGTWNASVSSAVSSYPEITTWEIWNEPWVSNFDTGYMNGSAYNYYMMIKSASQIIKAKEPNATIVCFGGAPIDDYYIYEWYAQVWSYGASNYCDAISIHAYPNGNSLINQSNTSEYWSEGLSAYENFTQKPIWITEVGMPSSSSASPSPYTPYKQEEFLAGSFSFFNQFPYVKRVYWYDLWALSNGQAANNFGLLNVTNPYSGTPSPAWNTFLSIYNRSSSKT